MNPPDPFAALDRDTAAGARAVLSRLSASDLVERGCVTVISIEAIRDRAADRWSRKRNDIYAYVARKLDEHLSFSDIRQRISETDFLIAMTGEAGVAAQAVSLKILEEVLMHFLGEAEPIDLKIRSVSSLQDTGLSCADLDPRQIARARQSLEAAYQRDVNPADAAVRNPVVFIADSGAALRIDFVAEAVISLQHRVTAALRIRPSITLATTGAAMPARAFAKLSDADIAVIDAAALAFGALFIPKDARSHPPVIVPAAFRNLAIQRTRTALLAIPGLKPEQLKQSLILELVDIDAGTPPGRLLEVTGLLAQLCRGVMARVHPGRDPLAPVRGARFYGLTLECAATALAPPERGVFLRGLAMAMRGKAPNLLALGLPAGDDLELAHEVGFSHASLKAFPAKARAAA